MLRSALVALATAVLAGPAAAQHNDVERRNTGYLWLEPTGHPNGNSFPDVRQNPPEHQTPAGVPVGTLSWVWIPSASNDRDEDEAIDGFRAPLGPSSATTAYPSLGYYPEVAVHRTVAAGGHVEPDPFAAPYLVLPEAPLVFPQFGYYLSGTNLMTPYLLDRQQKDVVVSLRWTRNDSRWTADTLNMWGDAYANVYDQPVFGFVTPTGQVTAVPMTGLQPGHLNLTYRRAQPSVNARSDWGRSWQPQALLPGLWGSSISTYQAPLASMAGEVAWDLQAGPAHAGVLAVPIFNVGPFFAGSYQVLGLTLELDVFDPALAVLASVGYVVTLDGQGFARAPVLPVPALGASLLGTHLAVEYLLLDAGNTMLTTSSQAAWVEVNR